MLKQYINYQFFLNIKAISIFYRFHKAREIIKYTEDFSIQVLCIQILKKKMGNNSFMTTLLPLKVFPSKV